ncbi:hypothetical protein F4780DRAFT_783993 [Xylariomycetidae sp. FL0641]|nr:hypothetical protein F4780DRAFT_783993 [Xylariomycetidae sp. FL0641]
MPTPSTPSNPPPTSASSPSQPHPHRGPTPEQTTAVIASVISAAVLVIVLAASARLLAIRRRQRRARQRQQLGVVVPFAPADLLPGRPRTLATTYHSAARGEVRVVIERPRLWPVPPGHQGRYTYHTAASTTAATEDPGEWSAASQFGSASACGSEEERNSAGAESIWGMPGERGESGT